MIEINVTYKLLKELPDLNVGALFTLDYKKGLYTHADWTFKKDTVEKNPDWFFEIKEGTQ